MFSFRVTFLLLWCVSSRTSINHENSCACSDTWANSLIADTQQGEGNPPINKKTRRFVPYQKNRKLTITGIIPINKQGCRICNLITAANT